MEDKQNKVDVRRNKNEYAHYLEGLQYNNNSLDDIQQRVRKNGLAAAGAATLRRQEAHS
jgi:uncharacterized protein YciU (UPF0263 family)